MKKIMKVVFGGIFAFGIMATASAQTDTSQNAPSGEDIICLQVEENVFECTLKNGTLEDEDVIDPKNYEDEIIIPDDEKDVPNFDEGNRDQDKYQEQYKNKPKEKPKKGSPLNKDDASENELETPTGNENKTEEDQSDGWSRNDILDQSDTAIGGENPNIITI